MSVVIREQSVNPKIEPRRVATGTAAASQLLYSLSLLVVLWLGWQITAIPVHVTIDGVSDTVDTHRRSVSALLADLGLSLNSGERVTPAGIDTLHSNQQLIVERPRVWRVLADGRDLVIHSWGTTPRAVLQDAAIPIERYDQVVIDGERYAADQPVPPVKTSSDPRTFRRGYAWDYLHDEPLQMRVRRAAEITVDEGGLPYSVFTTAPTVGESLRQADVTLYLGDRVIPSLGSSVAPGMRVYIQRSTPATVQFDGKVMKTRTRAATVGAALSELGIALVGLDEIQPPLETKLFPDIKVSIVRVRETIEVEEEITSFETVFTPDPNLPIDQQQMVNPGAEGITRNRYRVRFEDGIQVNRVLEDRWLAQSPTDRVVAYGQRIEPKTFTAADGTQLTYWRHIKMLASSYSAGTAGVSPDKSYYGKTFSGDPMRHGVVAVDLRVIPLRSRLYVPGYGVGDALDTGSAIRARRIDLGYDDGNLVLWNKWVDVYLLWPPPPAGEITWVIPNFPRPPSE